MAKYNKSRDISLINQKLRLLQTYPELVEDIKIRNNVMTCIMRLQPTPQSIVYKVRIIFKTSYFPIASLIFPKEIARFNGKKPHHLYNRDLDGKELLCVFYPKDSEWNGKMFLADSFVPWVITWLSAYEIWQITGEWVYPEAKSNGIKTVQRR